MNALALPAEHLETTNTDAPPLSSSESGVVASSPRDVGALLVLAIGHALSARGIDGSTLLATIGVTGRAMRIPASAYVQAWSVASELASDPELGLRGGHSLPPLALGVVDLCMSTAATPKEALAAFVREHTALAAAEELTLEEEGVSLVVKHVFADDAPSSYHVVEWLFATITARLRGYGTAAPSEVWFAHAAYDDGVHHTRIFGTQPRFGANESGLRFPLASLAKPIPSADPMMHALFVRRAQNEHGWKDASRSLTNAARTAAVESVSSGVGSVDDVAKRLGIPRRTLQRKLAEEGTTCKAVLETARFDAAMAVLTTRNTTIEDAAMAAGFYGTSAFYRAFRRWTGASPRHYERRQSGSLYPMSKPSSSASTLPLSEAQSPIDEQRGVSGKTQL